MFLDPSVLALRGSVQWASWGEVIAGSADLSEDVKAQLLTSHPTTKQPRGPRHFEGIGGGKAVCRGVSVIRKYARALQ